MSVYCVYHIIHVQTPHRYIPKLFITNVPDDKYVDWDMVDEYAEYGEFNTLHANHGITQLTKESSSSLRRAYREGDCERISFADLKALQEEEF